jgi:dynein heavy chain
VKCVLDALKEKKTKFQFTELGEIGLVDTVGFFITMNPGYAGRTELPENLKALFRSCAMVTPDLILICENMLLSEGFSTAKNLSKKFVTLYMLSRELLSKARHYDWGLRAVKSVLRQAGKLKRSDP